MGMFDPIQILVIIFALFTLSRAILRYRDKQITFWEFIFWSGIWICVIIIAINPSALQLLTRLSSIGKPIDIIAYGSIILLFYLIFRMYVRQENIEQDITKLVREVAKKKGKKK